MSNYNPKTGIPSPDSLPLRHQSPKPESPPLYAASTDNNNNAVPRHLDSRSPLFTPAEPMTAGTVTDPAYTASAADMRSPAMGKQEYVPPRVEAHDESLAAAIAAGTAAAAEDARVLHSRQASPAQQSARPDTRDSSGAAQQQQQSLPYPGLPKEKKNLHEQQQQQQQQQRQQQQQEEAARGFPGQQYPGPQGPPYPGVYAGGYYPPYGQPGPQGQYTPSQNTYYPSGQWPSYVPGQQPQYPQVAPAPSPYPGHQQQLKTVEKKGSRMYFTDDHYNITELRQQMRYDLSSYMSTVTKAARMSASPSLYDPGLLFRLSQKQSTVLTNLTVLKQHLNDVMVSSEKCRWRSWITGLVVWVPRIFPLVLTLVLQLVLTMPIPYLTGGAWSRGSIIPIIKGIFKRLARGNPDKYGIQAANSTEYAFKRSKNLTDYLKQSVLGRRGLAGLAMFVFAVLYVFQNEVLIRVARTMHKRVEKVMARVNRRGTLKEEDLDVLDGWRWRIISWAA